MKFQNPSFIFFEWTEARTHTRTHGCIDKPERICSPFFIVRGIIKRGQGGACMNPQSSQVVQNEIQINKKKQLCAHNRF